MKMLGRGIQIFHTISSRGLPSYLIRDKRPQSSSRSLVRWILHIIPDHVHFKCLLAPQNRHSVPLPRYEGFGVIYTEEVHRFDDSNDLISALKAWLLPLSPTRKRMPYS